MSTLEGVTGHVAEGQGGCTVVQTPGGTKYTNVKEVELNLQSSNHLKILTF